MEGALSYALKQWKIAFQKLSGARRNSVTKVMLECGARVSNPYIVSVVLQTTSFAQRDVGWRFKSQTKL